MDLTEKTIESQLIFQGKVVTLLKDRVLLPDGSSSIREYVKHVGAVCVIPVTENGEVILERQHRYSVGETLIEIPAGKLDSAREDPSGAALRELREETGIRAGTLKDLGIYYGSPAIMGEKIFMFLATDLSFGSTQLDEGEFLEVFRLPLEEAVKWVLNGTIRDGKTQCAILKAWHLFHGQAAKKAL